MVRQWFARLAEGDMGADLWHADLVIENVRTLVFEGVYHGYDGLERWWKDLADVFDELTDRARRDHRAGR